MASSWILTRTTKNGDKRFRVLYRTGGREAGQRYGGSFKKKELAVARKRWIDGELSARRVPDLRTLEADTRAPTLTEVSGRWQASRVDVRDSTKVQHRTALGRVLPTLGHRRVDGLTTADVAGLVAELVEQGKARESIRKSLTALAMVLDYAGLSPNVARDRVHVKLPRQEPTEPEPPTAEAVEKVARLLTPAYRIALLTLDATGCRVGELEAARVGDLDEERRAWLVRAAVSKTRRPRWVALPDDLYAAVIGRLPPREDRRDDLALFPGVTADKLRTAVGRACRAAAVPHFNLHSLRHRRISLEHRKGRSWAEIGEAVGQRSKLVTADRYSHALVDYKEINYAKVLR
jgi:integrase